MGTVIHPTAVIHGLVEFGANVQVHAGVVIGDEPEHRFEKGNMRDPIIIGDNTVLREHVVVQRGIPDGPQTRIGPDCYVMHGSHIAHNCVVEGKNNLSPFAVMGGHTTLMEAAIMGIQSSLHQYVVVGSYSMIGMGAMVIDDVPPGVIARGMPARVYGQNTVGLQRAGDDDILAKIEIERARWNQMRRRRHAKQAQG